VVVKPDTLKKWHREGFRIYWRRKSKGKSRKPRITPEAIALIQQMALENRTWGAKRIRDELRKLGHRVSKRTVRKYMKQARRDLPPRQSGQTWATFLKNHPSEIWACDFVQTYDLFFRTIFVFFIIELESRRVVHFGVTRSPSDAWVAQQWRNATPFEEGPRFLIRDNDDKFGAHFSSVTDAVDVLRTPVRAPKANAICERFIGSVRRECLDHVIILSERHLRRLIREYVAYFNHALPHQGIDRIPDPLNADRSDESRTDRPVIAVPVLGGLHHDYQRAA
jgi:putative transposase